MPLIAAIPPIHGRGGRPRRRPEAVYADRGYDHYKDRRQVWAKGITPVIACRAQSIVPLSARSPLGGGAVDRAAGSGGCGSAGRSATPSMRPSLSLACAIICWRRLTNVSLCLSSYSG
jgi:hypothetical protein